MKGYTRLLEALVAGLMVLSALLILFSGAEQKPRFEVSALKEIGYDCLKDLDNKGLLRYHAINNNTSQLKAELATCLPSTVNITVALCNNGCSLPQQNKTTVVSHYFIAGEGSVFLPTEVNLQVWLE